MEEAERTPGIETDVEADAEADEADWFGEGSPFDSEALLAAALPDILETPRRVAPPRAVDPSPPPLPAAIEDQPALAADAPSEDDEHYFEVMERREKRADGTIVIAAPASPAPAWSVRTPGVEPLPQRQPGRTGWSISNSVRILRRAEDLVMRLRQEAVVAAFNAAARALHGED